MNTSVNDTQAVYWQGDRYLQKRHYKEAEGLFLEVLERDAGHKEAMLALGVVYLSIKEYGKANQILEKLVKLDSKMARAYFLLGHAAEGMGYWLRAYELYNEALKYDGRYKDAVIEIEKICQQHHEPDILRFFSQKYIDIWPEDGVGYLNMAILMFGFGEYRGAVELCEKCLALGVPHQGKLASVYSLLGAAYGELGQLEKSYDYFRRALVIAPNDVNLLQNYATALQMSEECERVEEILKKIIALAPNHVGALNSLGVLYTRLGQFSLALECFDKAIYYNPEDHLLHLNRAMVYLDQGDLMRGFKEYEHRFGVKKYYPSGVLQKSVWDGSELENKRLLIFAEHGLGDMLQFVRYLPMLRQRYPNATIYVEARKALMTLFEYNFSSIATIVMQGNIPTHDALTGLMSMPKIFQTTMETIPNRVPYLQVPKDLVEKWKKVLGPTQKKRVGIVWSGSMKHKLDIYRTCSIEDLSALLVMKDFEFISLQVEYRGDELEKAKRLGVREFSKEIKDLLDTAAIIENLDVVISVDTSVVHLTGALAKPVWIMLPFVGEWRWQQKGSTNAWYPTARLFRQAKMKDWTMVVRSLQEALMQEFLGR